jgi:hypothetical protein
MTGIIIVVIIGLTLLNAVVVYAVLSVASYWDDMEDKND